MLRNIAEVLSDAQEANRRLAEVTEILVSKSVITSDMIEESSFAKRDRETRERAQRLRYAEDFAINKQDLKIRIEENQAAQHKPLAELFPKE